MKSKIKDSRLDSFTYVDKQQYAHRPPESYIFYFYKDICSICFQLVSRDQLYVFFNGLQL